MKGLDRMNKNRKDVMDESPAYPDDMLSIINEGLQVGGKPMRVIILGAGMAGLVAGSLLKEAGHHVTILEGNYRVGGRVFTMRKPFSKGNYMDVGAMRIPNSHKLVLAFIKQFKLPVNNFINSTPYDILYVNGVKTQRYLYDQDPSILKYPVATKYKDITALQVFLDAVEPFVNLYNNATPEEKIKIKKKYDQYSFGTFLKNNPFGN